MSHVNFAVAINIAISALLAIWAILQFFLTRTGRKAEIARQNAETEKITEARESNNRRILSEAQIAAQKAALDSNDVTIRRITHDYEDQRRSLNDLRSATEELIDILEELIGQISPSNKDSQVVITVTWDIYRSAKTAIRAARSHVW
jgi:Fe-S cluster assembly scaffold protein SufB